MGVEYLYGQTGKTWSSDVSRLDPDEPDELTDELTDGSLAVSYTHLTLPTNREV